MLECAVALLLVTDVSGSMQPYEYQMQQEGLAAAFTSNDFQNILKIQPGGIAVGVIQFGNDAVVSVPWTIMTTPADAEKLAIALTKIPRIAASYSTGIGNAIHVGTDYFDQAPCKARLKVMDISGDGYNNTEYPTHSARDDAIAKDIVINGLAIQAANSEPDIAGYYRRDIATPEGFVIDAKDYSDFARSIRKKIALEVSMNYHMGR